jgi:DNA-binding transcriptional MerR regulator
MYGLSRSTLLYYDSIGLLKPRERSPSGYRLYSPADRDRLRRIVLFRSLGVPLERMRDSLESPDSGALSILLERLFAISGHIRKLGAQQETILAMIEADGTLKGAKSRMHGLTDVGRRAGITSGNARELHRVFEAASPRLHRRLLAFLGFSKHDAEAFILNLEKA